MAGINGKDPTWKGFFRKVDDELCRVSKTFWTMTGGKEHRVRWVCNKGKWGLTPIYPTKGSQRVSYLSCVHRIPERTRFWKKLHVLMGDGGRVVVFTQGCQATYPVPPRLAGIVPDAPSVEDLIKEMSHAGLTACCAKVYLIKREVPKTKWSNWLLSGCFSDMNYCDKAEIEGFIKTLQDPVEVIMSYYCLVGIKLGPQSGLIDIRPSSVHGLSACARAELKPNWVLLSVPSIEKKVSRGGVTAEWHSRGKKIGLHLCSTVYRLFNHSSTPNCRLTSEGLIMTNRVIEAGEELTLDYNAVPS